MPAATLKQVFRHQLDPNLETSPICNFGEVSKGRPQAQPCINPTVLETGTVLANSDHRNGVAPQLPCRPSGRGGARNSASRESDRLSAGQVAHLMASERHAAAIGLPFTRMITIHWEAAGVPLADMAKATGRFIDLMSKALARHGAETAWIWVHEGGERKGGHCHMLVHVPAGLVPVISRLQKGWLRRITGQRYSAGVIYSRPIGARLGLDIGNPELHAVNLAVAFGYLCKGASQSVLDTFGIDRAHEAGGRVIGKRCGASQNIGAKARKAMSAEAACNEMTQNVMHSAERDFGSLSA